MNYITIEELRKAPFNLVESELDATQSEFLLAMTKEFIDDACKQDFLKEGATGTEVEKRISGTNNTIIFLPKRLVTLKEVKLYDSSQVSRTYTAGEFFYHPKYIQWLDNFIDPSPRVRVENFQMGVANVGVVGIWGFETVPMQIKYLQGRIVQKIVRTGYMTEKNKSESVGDYSSSPMMIQSVITGDSEIDTIIKRNTDVRIHVPS